MVDTVRTRTALQALLPDNTEGDISPQDIRDFLVSVFPPQFSGASLSKSVAQNVANSATVTWDGTHWDTDSYADLANNRFQIPVGLGGFFLISATVATLNNTGGNSWATIVYSSAEANPFDLRLDRQSDISTATHGGSAILKLAAGDTVHMTIDGDAAFDARGSNDGTWFQIVRLGQVPV